MSQLRRRAAAGAIACLATLALVSAPAFADPPDAALPGEDAASRGGDDAEWPDEDDAPAAPNRDSDPDAGDDAERAADEPAGESVGERADDARGQDAERSRGDDTTAVGPDAPIADAADGDAADGDAAGSVGDEQEPSAGEAERAVEPATEPQAEPVVYSAEVYVAMKDEMLARSLEARETHPGTPARRDALRALATDINGLIGYLNAWERSAEMPPGLAEEAANQRYFLFENLVQIYAELHACLASETALESMRTGPQPPAGTDAADVWASAQRVAQACVEPPVVAEVVDTRSPAGQGGIALAAAVGLVGVVLMSLDDDGVDGRVGGVLAGGGLVGATAGLIVRARARRSAR